MSKPSRRTGGLTAACLAGLMALAPAAAARADTLTVNADTSDAQPKAAMQEAVKRFEAANPGTHVVLNVYDHESYKQSIRNWLTSAPPDVVLWDTGARLRQFVQPGLLADVSVLWTPAMKQAFGNTAVELSTEATPGVPAGRSRAPAPSARQRDTALGPHRHTCARPCAELW